MGRSLKIAIVSDLHYAGAAERARGNDYEYRDLSNPFVRLFIRCYRRFIWLPDPLNYAFLLDKFLELVGPVDYLIANGDYSCDSAFIGMSDEAARASALECLGKLRRRHPANFRALIGDHELGKLSFFGGRGGMRLESWRRVREELALEPAWRVELGRYVLIGATSSLVAFPAYESDSLPEERAEWRRLREEHLAELRRLFTSVEPGRPILFFCHDPTALPFLWHDEAVRAKLPQIEQTFIGHLHSNLIFRKSRLLAGMPVIKFLGHTPQKMTQALSEGRFWRPFRVRLCPAVAGIQLLKDGGFYTAELDPEAREPARFQFHPIPR